MSNWNRSHSLEYLHGIHPPPYLRIGDFRFMVLNMESVPQSGEQHIELQRNRLILVVDDDPAIRLLNVEVLKWAGYSVDTAENGALGWAALKARRYDLLITDNNMPIMSGTALLNELRKAGMTLPVILATGTLSNEEIDQSPILKTACILHKPFTINMLLGTVKGLLQ